VSYCIDTSALIAAWSERYPIRRFKPFWDKMDGLAASQRLVAPEDVRREIQKKADGLYKWVNERKPMFVELEESVQQSARDILRDYPWLLKNVPGKSPADPFVIALAKVRGLVVVTEEGRGSTKKPKIPDVCEAVGIHCVNLLGLLEEEDWTI
jgi:hypothetical protein